MGRTELKLLKFTVVLIRNEIYSSLELGLDYGPSKQTVNCNREDPVTIAILNEDFHVQNQERSQL